MHGEITGKAQWPAIIPEDKWRAVCAILGNPARRVSPGPRPKHLGSNIYLCGVCADEGTESFMVGQTSRAKGRAYYHCKTTLHLNQQRDPIDEVVVSEITGRLSRPDAARLLRERKGSNSVSRALLTETNAALRRKLIELGEAYKSDRISIAQFSSVSADLERQLKENESAMVPDVDYDPLAGIAGKPDAAEIWETLPVERQRAVIRRMCEVWVYRQERQRNQYTPFDPDSVYIEWLG
jgi:hypothetical protein